MWADTAQQIGDAVYHQFGEDGMVNDLPARLMLWQESVYEGDGTAIAQDRRWRMGVRTAEIAKLQRGDVVVVGEKRYRIDAIAPSDDGHEQQAWLRESRS